MTATLRPTSVDARMGVFWGIVVLFLLLGALFRPTLASLDPEKFPMTSPVVMESLASGETLYEMVTGKTSLPFSVLFVAPRPNATAEELQVFTKYVLPFRNHMGGHLALFGFIGMVVAGAALAAMVKARKI
ncbi:hypothetical protein [Agrobacterium cavarae]